MLKIIQQLCELASTQFNNSAELALTEYKVKWIFRFKIYIFKSNLQPSNWVEKQLKILQSCPGDILARLW